MIPTLKLTTVIDRELDRFIREGEREFRRELRKNFRQAGNVVRDAARSEARQQFPQGTGDLARKIRVSVKVTARTQTATVGPKGGSLAYAKGHVHEFGGTRQRRASRTRRAHTATYPAKPFLGPAAERTASRVYDMIGRSFVVLSLLAALLLPTTLAKQPIQGAPMIDNGDLEGGAAGWTLLSGAQVTSAFGAHGGTMALRVRTFQVAYNVTDWLLGVSYKSQAWAKARNSGDPLLISPALDPATGDDGPRLHVITATHHDIWDIPEPGNLAGAALLSSTPIDPSDWVLIDDPTWQMPAGVWPVATRAWAASPVNDVEIGGVHYVGDGSGDWLLDDISARESMVTTHLREQLEQDLLGITTANGFPINIGDVSSRNIDPTRVATPAVLIVPGDGGEEDPDQLNEEWGIATQEWQLDCIVRDDDPHFAMEQLLDSVRRATGNRNSRFRTSAIPDGQEGAHTVIVAGPLSWASEFRTDESMQGVIGRQSVRVRARYTFDRDTV